MTSLGFTKENLFSGSLDRTVKVWSAAELGYIESLFGHSAGICGLSTLGERIVTCSADKTCRVWKISEESQLVYQDASGYSVDVVTFLNDSMFCSGGQDGSVSLWSGAKRKPVSVFIFVKLLFIVDCI